MSKFSFRRTPSQEFFLCFQKGTIFRPLFQVSKCTYIHIEACATAAAIIQEDPPTKKERREQMGASASILEKASEEQKAEITAEIEKLKADILISNLFQFQVKASVRC